MNKIHIEPLLKAFAFLQTAIKTAKTDLEKAGAIQAFEFCYELSWKTMKRILTQQGLDVTTPRDVFREAARAQLIKDPEIWFDFIKKRNLTVHTYNLKIAEEIFQSLPRFSTEVQQFIDKIQR